MAGKLSCRMGDAYGRTTNRVYGMETQTLLADYVTAYTAFLTALEAVTDLSLIKADLILPVIGLDWAVVAGANLDTGATASGWLDAGTGKKASLKIPGIKPALVAADGTVAIAGATATFLDEFITTGDFNLSDGEQVEVGGWIRATLDR